MDWLTAWLIGFASERNHPAGFALLFGAALLEYVVPPFPGDTITLFGAVLITGYGWSAVLLSLVVLLGSLCGLLFDYWIGMRLRARPRSGHGKVQAAMDRLVAGFDRHGAIYLVINRFVPGIRALFFVAAGMAAMPLRDVVLYGGLSVLLYNGLLMGLGAALGANLDSLGRWYHQYTRASWIALAAAVGVYLAWRVARAVLRRRERRRSSGEPPSA